MRHPTHHVLSDGKQMCPSFHQNRRVCMKRSQCVVNAHDLTHTHTHTHTHRHTHTHTQTDTDTMRKMLSNRLIEVLCNDLYSYAQTKTMLNKGDTHTHTLSLSLSHT